MGAPVFLFVFFLFGQIKLHFCNYGGRLRLKPTSNPLSFLPNSLNQVNFLQVNFPLLKVLKPQQGKKIREAEAKQGGRRRGRAGFCTFLPRCEHRQGVLPRASRLVSARRSCARDAPGPRGATAAKALGRPASPLRLCPGTTPKPRLRPAEAPGPGGSARPLPASSASGRAGPGGRRRGRAPAHGGLPAPLGARGRRAGRAEATRGGAWRPGSPSTRTRCLPRGLRGLLVPESCSARGWESRPRAVRALLRWGGWPLPARAPPSGPAGSPPARSLRPAQS